MVVSLNSRLESNKEEEEKFTVCDASKVYPGRQMSQICHTGPGFRVQGSGFRVQGSGFRGQGSGFRVQGSGFWLAWLAAAELLPSGHSAQLPLPLEPLYVPAAQCGLGFRVQGLGFGVWGLGCRVQGVGFRV